MHSYTQPQHTGMYHLVVSLTPNLKCSVGCFPPSIIYISNLQCLYASRIPISRCYPSPFHPLHTRTIQALQFLFTQSTNYIPSIAGCLWISREYCFWIISIAYYSHYHCMNERINELWYVWPGKKTDRPQPPKPTTLHTTYPSAILVNHHRIAVSIANPSEGQELVRHNLSLCLSHMNMLRFPIANILYYTLAQWRYQACNSSRTAEVRLGSGPCCFCCCVNHQFTHTQTITQGCRFCMYTKSIAVGYDPFRPTGETYTSTHTQ